MLHSTLGLLFLLAPVVAELEGVVRRQLGQGVRRGPGFLLFLAHLWNSVDVA